MNNINYTFLKKLRKKTNISIYKCKKALKEHNNDYKKALTSLINFNTINNNNKNNIPIPKQGVIKIKKKKNQLALIQIHCETDFVLKNKLFIKLTNKILTFIFQEKNSNLNNITTKFKKQINWLINIVNENIVITNVLYIQHPYFGYYVHNNYKIATIILYTSTNYSYIQKKKIKKIAMHLAAIPYKYIYKKQIPIKYLNQFKKNIIQQYKEKYKKNISLNKFKKKLNNMYKQNIFVEQSFIFNTKITIQNYLNKYHLQIQYLYKYHIN